MRMLHDHEVDGRAVELEVVVLDEPGRGGACADYLVRHQGAGNRVAVGLTFQRGPVGDAGPNGITNEALIAVVVDRLRGFQAGPGACPENADALASLESALSSLRRRTADRIARDVEGTVAP